MNYAKAEMLSAENSVYQFYGFTYKYPHVTCPNVENPEIQAVQFWAFRGRMEDAVFKFVFF
jgi:hypothetical protein